MLLRGERTGTVFSLGQPVRVKVQNVELTQCNIDLTLLTPLKGRVASGQRSERKQERDRMRGFNRS
jgi:transcriptional accessory protein Tex/SPT6